MKHELHIQDLQDLDRAAGAFLEAAGYRFLDRRNILDL